MSNPGEFRRAAPATRLLPVETDAVRNSGLRIASPELLVEKLQTAARHHPEVMAEADVQRFLKMSPVVTDTYAERAGLLHVVTPFAVFDDERANGRFGYLVDMWGGEIISFTGDERCEAIVERMSALSQPTIAEFAMPVDDLPSDSLSFLWPSAVGKLLGLEDLGTSWTLDAPLEATYLVNLLHPVHPRWPARLRVHN